LRDQLKFSEKKILKELKKRELEQKELKKEVEIVSE